MLEINQNTDNNIQITGELNFMTVPELSKANRALICHNSKTVFDLSSVTSSDNTGAALLVSLSSFAKSLQKEVMFINLPKQLMDIVEVVGVKDLLPIQ